MWIDLRKSASALGVDPMKLTVGQLRKFHGGDFILKVGKHRFIKFI